MIGFRHENIFRKPPNLLTTTQRRFRTCSGLNLNMSVSDQKTILKWEISFRTRFVNPKNPTE